MQDAPRKISARCLRERSMRSKRMRDAIAGSVPHSLSRYSGGGLGWGPSSRSQETPSPALPRNTGRVRKKRAPISSCTRSGRTPRIALAIPILSALALLLLPAIAFARAGGGEGYHGGGGGGGHGGGGGGGGDGWIIYYLIQLLFTHPLIGIPVLIIAILIYIKFQNQSGVDLSGGGGGFTPMNRPSAPLR